MPYATKAQIERARQPTRRHFENSIMPQTISTAADYPCRCAC